MIKIACICLTIVAAMPLFSQVEPSATGGGFSLDDSRMMTPPPVSNGAYPATVGAETRSNYVTGGLVVTGAYNDNVLVGGTQKVGDSSYSIVPMISFDRRTSHQSVSMSYNSGFTLYQNTTSLNGITQGGTAGYRFHLSPYAVLSVSDTFTQNHNLFNQPNPFSGSGLSASGPSPTSVYVYPFQNQLGNSINGALEYQYGRNAMVGGGGTYSILRFSNLSSTPGVANSNANGGSAFWSRRLTPGQYAGVIYQYSNITTQPIQTSTITNTVFGFYTRYLTRTVSISVLGGPQHFHSSESVPSVVSGSWTPAIQGSVSYQKARTNLAADYSHIVSGAGGLVGAYHSNIADLQARRQITSKWSVGANVSYALFKNVTPEISSFSSGGHTIAGVASVQRNFHERFRMEVGYGRFHQSYGQTPPGTQVFPDCNREYASVTYGFYRPIGR